MSTPSYCFKLATAPSEVSGYFALRHSIFVDEQQLFQGCDVDAMDAIAYPIIALAAETAERQRRRSVGQLVLPLTHHPVLSTHHAYPTQNTPVLGVVRIYEPEPGLWYGGRLGVHEAHRRAARIGKGLIYKAVTTANTWGCDRFLATVQLQNVRFFQRQHWHSLEELTIHGLPHHLMEADLNYYPPSTEQRPALSSFTREAS
ncbi:GNAT family N-acetyltransferase [Phormidium sp. FACHB-592]|uniref:GNAT family N-acetyltransferase n=1 Tax=Stenomitos frigidus AS-A4 TaxID=2933935 RepID=A0ABV0KDM4_9CYAN|nr:MULTISPECIES: MSMEG_0567/Sll0786 family nitrogen starvation N-acetyltransferase [Cyanophyceae]MBD2038027.1 GNAT family N-acetyltransferase [Leptolyngbya sp. FACHB-321]MBD2077771.1 GNAT family N-acetyltransferase [Phormidium sp. FACHB-592]